MAASRTQLTLQLATAALLVLVVLGGCGPDNPRPLQVQPDPPPIAGTGTISGFVREAQSLHGQGGITVRVRQGAEVRGADVTEPNGRFFITGLPLTQVTIDLDAPPASSFADRENAAVVGLDITPTVESDLIIFTIFDVPPGPSS